MAHGYNFVALNRKDLLPRFIRNELWKAVDGQLPSQMLFNF